MIIMRKPSGGFTLIELAIGLVIIVAFMSMGLGALTATLTSAAYSDTRAKQERIKLALTAYLGANKRLPCPDDPNTGGITGIEDPLGGGTCTTQFGAIPYATLALNIDAVTDGWGNLMSYQAFSEAGVCPGTTKKWSQATCFGAGKIGGLTIMDKTIVIEPAAVAVIVSHGPNGHGAWGRQGTRNIDPLTCEEAHNNLFAGLGGCTLSVNLFYKGERQDNDDVVAFLNSDDMIRPLARQGDLLSAAGQANADLAALYDQALSQKGAACSTTVSLSTPLYDPWGGLYHIQSGNPSFPIMICTANNLHCKALEAASVNARFGLACS